jgi:hypothetical protein
VQLARSLGSAFGVAIAGAVLFIVLSTMDPNAATLFFEMICHGPSVLAALPAEQRGYAGRHRHPFRSVFLTVASFSCIIVATAQTM